jgi:hypothetical protein
MCQLIMEPPGCVGILNGMTLPLDVRALRAVDRHDLLGSSQF